MSHETCHSNPIKHPNSQGPLSLLRFLFLEGELAGADESNAGLLAQEGPEYLAHGSDSNPR